MQHPYRLDPKPLGRGGQAEVFRATNRRNPLSEVALKRLTGFSEASRQRFRREIEIQRELSSFYVMPIIDASDDFTWYTMPLATQYFSEFRDRSDNEIAEALLHVARGLSVAHSKGIVHRDVKPANILKVGDDKGSRWVIADFGLTRRDLEDLSMQITTTGQFVGTAAYAAPEMWQDSHRALEPADVCSLGRVAAWATSTGNIIPMRPVTSDREGWREFVGLLTAETPETRPNIEWVVHQLEHRLIESLPGHEVDPSYRLLDPASQLRCVRCKRVFDQDKSDCPYCRQAPIDY